MTMIERLRANALAAMGEREAAVRAAWGEDFEDFLTYLAFAAGEREASFEILKYEIWRRSVRRTLVVTGERCTGAAEDGSDSPLLLGMHDVAKLLAPVSCMESEGRNGREPNALTLFFSGGSPLTRSMGEYLGSEMAAQFNAMTSDAYAPCVQFENASLNTGDQGRVIGGLAFARNVDRVVVVHVVDHIARFAATIAAAIDDLICAHNARLQKIVGVDTRFGLRKMPEFFFYPCGDWKDLA